MYNFLNKFRTQSVHTQPQLELDKARLANANNQALQLHFDRMQTALNAIK